ncbi:hypothetical protein V2H77_17425 [Photorhabdus sp. P32]|uniref:hypothetical protein n=1 Tax=Photorhabdus sp. P32 TaxID=3117549 RepID=UPI00311AFD7C
MDTDLISYEAMIAAQDSARWAFYAMLGTWFSGLITLCAVIYAKKALTTWKKQEKVKVKMDFKKALIQVIDSIIYMPDWFDMSKASFGKKILTAGEAERSKHLDAIELSNQFDVLTRSMTNAHGCWIYCEHFFDGTEVVKEWENVIALVDNYIKGNAKQDDVIDALDSLSSKRFVFNE